MLAGFGSYKSTNTASTSPSERQETVVQGNLLQCSTADHDQKRQHKKLLLVFLLLLHAEAARQS